MTPIVKTPPTLSCDEERVIYTAIEAWTMSVDGLLSVTKYDMTTLLTHVAMLEINGHIRMNEMGRYLPS
jgi:predicted Rossmann fold nucleotide-binding protein DprA/Smf involved in DNA uptake